jgi:hypothetical protein
MNVLVAEKLWAVAIHRAGAGAERSEIVRSIKRRAEDLGVNVPSYAERDAIARRALRAASLADRLNLNPLNALPQIGNTPAAGMGIPCGNRLRYQTYVEYQADSGEVIRTPQAIFSSVPLTAAEALDIATQRAPQSSQDYFTSGSPPSRLGVDPDSWTPISAVLSTVSIC